MMFRFSSGRCFVGGLLSFSLLVSACGETSQADSASGAPAEVPFEGTEVPVPDVLPGQEEFAQLQQDLVVVEGMDGAGLQSRYPSVSNTTLSYTPSESDFMELIQASALGLSDNELAALDQNGFVISTRSTFPTFLRG